jgi:hypothetical protein
VFDASTRIQTKISCQGTVMHVHKRYSDFVQLSSTLKLTLPVSMNLVLTQ